MPLTFSTRDTPSTTSAYVYSFPISILEPHNALSVVVTFAFEVGWVNIALKDRQGRVVATARHESLEDVKQSPTKPVIDQEANMMAIVEVPKIERGEYTLEVSVNKLVFLGAKQDSCVSANLMLEYVSRKAISDNRFKYEILGIFPPRLNSLSNKPDSHLAKAMIEVKFD